MQPVKLHRCLDDVGQRVERVEHGSGSRTPGEATGRGQSVPRLGPFEQPVQMRANDWHVSGDTAFGVSATYDARRLRELPRSVSQDRCCSDAELFVSDDVVQLIYAHARAAPSASVTRRLSFLMDIHRFDDPRIFAFLLRVLTDRREPVQVRSYTLRCVRTTGLSAAHFESAAAALVEMLAAESSLDLRVQAALALGWFVDASWVLAETRSNLDADGSQCEDGVSQRWRSAMPQ